MKKLLALLLLSLTVSVQAELKLATVFTDHAVLQRGQPIPVWGTAAPDTVVTVTLNNKAATATTGADGKWLAKLPASPAVSEPLTLTVTDGVETVTVSDVLVGEVWLCSGQSNMEWNLVRANNGDEEVAAADHPQIRLLQITKKLSPTPLADITDSWQVCTPASAKNFSAVGYFFGRDLWQKLNVPVGLINSSWGGTPAETWTRAAALADEPAFTELLAIRGRRVGNAPGQTPDLEAKQKKEADGWNNKIKKLLAASGKPDPAWFKPGASADGWNTFAIPGSIERASGVKADGSFWVRKQFTLTAEQAAGEATLHLGAIDDFDFTWLNDKLIGKMGIESPNAWSTPRAYKIPVGTLKPGDNVLVIRAIDRQYDCSINGSDSDQYLATADGQTVPLAGADWQARLETNLGISPIPEMGLQNVAGVLYDGMIAPLVPYGIRGAIWYQGESNASRAKQYQKLFPRLITNWREDWGQGDFPFYFVQLANYMARHDQPTESQWAELREAQLKTLSLTNTGMAVAIDIGEAKDIHPRNKQEVGRRLALIALSRDYGVKEPALLWHKRPVPYSGPVFRAMKVSGDQAVLYFDHADGGLVNTNPAEPLQGFTISGDGQTFVWARAVINGDKLIVTADGIAKPVAVRYAWADNPAATLANAAGLPATPFRTDQPEE